MNKSFNLVRKDFIMKTIISTLTLSVFTLFIFSSIGCKKKNTAGLGGDNELHVKVRHHAVVQDSVTVYIKFNVEDAPVNTADYDINEKVKIANGDTLAIFTGLKEGDYYLYGYGYDRDLFDNVAGGLPLKLENSSSATSINLQVTEAGH